MIRIKEAGARLRGGGSAVTFFQMVLAERKIEVEFRYPQTLQRCRDYLQHFDKPDFTVGAEPGEIEELRRASDVPDLGVREDRVAVSLSGSQFESLIIHRKISDELLRRQTLLAHGAAIALENRGFLFTAPSGTGKTTHILNWLKVIPGTEVINGDKPFVNAETLRVYGSPWCGKENMQTNRSVPLSGLIELRRGTENRMERIGFGEMLPALLRQVYIPEEDSGAVIAYRLCGLLGQVPCYRLTCTPDPDSARVARRGLTGGADGDGEGLHI